MKGSAIMLIDSDDLEKAHNDGQTDASNGVNHRPFSALQISSPLSCCDTDEMEALNNAYDEGHSHTESQQKSGCFLTTACVQAAGLPDDCHELAVLRHFRDTFVRARDDGDALIREYYDQSPRIVTKLSKDELKAVYMTVQIAVAQIDRSEFDAAFRTYSEMFKALSIRHLAMSYRG